MFRLGGDAAATAKKLTEEVAETRSPARRPGCAAKIKPAKIKVHAGLLGALSSGIAPWRQILAVEAVLVVHLALFRIGKHIVGFLDLLELFFRRFVAWIQVRVIFARQPAKRSADVLYAGLTRHA